MFGIKHFGQIVAEDILYSDLKFADSGRNSGKNWDNGSMAVGRMENSRITSEARENGRISGRY